MSTSPFVSSSDLFPLPYPTFTAHWVLIMMKESSHPSLMKFLRLLLWVTILPFTFIYFPSSAFYYKLIFIQYQAQFDAGELITQRELVSQKVSEALTERAGQFGLILDDISIVSSIQTRAQNNWIEWYHDIISHRPTWRLEKNSHKPLNWNKLHNRMPSVLVSSSKRLNQFYYLSIE